MRVSELLSLFSLTKASLDLEAFFFLVEGSDGMQYHSLALHGDSQNYIRQLRENTCASQLDPLKEAIRG